MNLDILSTEQRNEKTMNIDELSSLEMVKVINNEDKTIAFAVEKEGENIAKAIDGMSERFIAGGRIIYIGAGTSGRLGVLDGVELTPTYSVPATRVFGIIAGGEKAMYVAVEGAEDSKELAIEDLKKVSLTEGDVVIAIAASGRTPYAISALEFGKEKGAFTISVTCNKDSVMNEIADVGIAPIVGPEVVTGSTRMKAGTAQKMVLNILSTGTMIKSGKVFENLMINVQATNKKLVQRSINIIRDAIGLSFEEAEILFNASGKDVTVAIVMGKTGATKEASEKALAQNKQVAKNAIKSIMGA